MDRLTKSPRADVAAPVGFRNVPVSVCGRMQFASTWENPLSGFLLMSLKNRYQQQRGTPHRRDFEIEILLADLMFMGISDPSHF